MPKKLLNKIKEKTATGVKETKRELAERTAALVLGGFGLVAALAWNEAIQNFFNNVFPRKSGMVGKFLYAVIATIILVVISLWVGRISNNNKK